MAAESENQLTLPRRVCAGASCRVFHEHACPRGLDETETGTLTCQLSNYRINSRRERALPSIGLRETRHRNFIGREI